jgi:hypothetical protein
MWLPDVLKIGKNKIKLKEKEKKKWLDIDEKKRNRCHNFLEGGKPGLFIG